jgi:hypothetical protein
MDWKGMGYAISIISVLLIGIVAWPGSADPPWHLPVLVMGMTASVLGMAFRYKAHKDQQRDIRRAKSDARTTCADEN